VYRHKLYLAFALLVSLAVVQATLSLWTSQTAATHVERSRIANQMLAEFIALGADKQRLKVWLAQALLIQDQAPQTREKYLQQMQASIQTLNRLILLDQQLADTSADFAAINTQQQTVSILSTNISMLQYNLQQKAARQQREPLDPAQTWRLLIEIFDNLEGLDLKHLIAEAIELQKSRSEQAEIRASEALQQARLLVLTTCITAMVLAIWLALLLARSVYRPLQQLLQGTSALAEGQLDTRLPEQGQQEFRLLARSFNQLAASLQRARNKEAQYIRQTEQIVTDRTAQLQEAIAQLQQAEQRQQRFLADVSHELRTPATTIRGEAEIALRGADKSADDYKLSLIRIVETTAELTDRIDDLLLLIRSEQNMQLHFKQQSVQSLWPQWLEQAQRFCQAQQVSCLSDTPTATVLAQQLYLDPVKTAQALQILLDNAVRYGAHRPIHLAATLHQDCLQLSVSDSGIGVEPPEQAHIFQRYYRSAPARQLRPDGLGIGLALCQALLKAQHGEVKVQSPLHQPIPTPESASTAHTPGGPGSCFSLCLPLVETSAEQGVTDASDDH